MWSLPDIKRLNDAASEGKNRLEECLKSKTDPQTLEHAICDCCDQRAEHGLLYYDIFSDDPKGIIWYCPKCWEEHAPGGDEDRFFLCNDCGRLMIANYTWENYFHNGEDGRVCLNCYARQVLDEKSSWISLTKKTIDSIGFDALRSAAHIIAVEGPTHGLVFHGNVEFDSLDGHCISGGGIDEVKERLDTLRKTGHKRAIIILDAAYQFSVSLGVYTQGKGKPKGGAK